MSSLAEVTRIAEDVFKAALPKGTVEEVRVEDGSDEEGQPALRVLAIVKPAAVKYDDDSIDAQLSAKADLQWKLGEAGEQRFAYVRLVTREELDVES